MPRFRSAAPIAFRPLTARRTFISSPAAYKTVTETVKDAAATVNRVVSDAALGGIEGGEKVVNAAKEQATPLADAVKNVSWLHSF